MKDERWTVKNRGQSAKPPPIFQKIEKKPIKVAEIAKELLNVHTFVRRKYAKKKQWKKTYNVEGGLENIINYNDGSISTARKKH